MGLCSSSRIRRLVASASNWFSTSRSRTSRRFLRTSVPGYTYGSIFSVEVRIEGGLKFLRCQFTIDIAPEQCLCVVRRLKPLDAHARDRIFDFSPSQHSCLV